MEIKSNNTFVSTSFWGDTIFTNAKELIRLFGDYKESDPLKVNYEQNLILDNKIPFSIYDWKEPDLTMTQDINYHIGARNEKESKEIAKVLNKIINN